MNFFYWIFLIVAVVYGGLTVFSVIQPDQNKISLLSRRLMAAGGVLVALSPFISLALDSYTVIILVLGLLMIHISAINNGLKMYEKVNIKHHIVRLAVSILILLMFFLR